MSIYDVYRWENDSTPGRMDVNGVEWWACDPMPTWYRWDEEGELHTYPAAWVADDPHTELGKALEEERKARTVLANAMDRVSRARDSIAAAMA